MRSLKESYLLVLKWTGEKNFHTTLAEALNKYRSIWTILWKMSRVKLVREAGAKTNNLAGDGCTTSIVLARGLAAEGYCNGSKCCSS
ncbi:uncharacterized protein LOC142174749 isoform X1 [Nicotiana tabacum]|uniref:Uncharacterized protein LOC142174749 isoform X1 n=2 Tax=Nicotiana tabacum TaxID=4097 RepID=A0AC58TIJ6_TOBAC